MSSVVKKSTHFVPKLKKKKVIRKAAGTKDSSAAGTAATLTPPASQATQKDPESSQDTTGKESTLTSEQVPDANDISPITPVATQNILQDSIPGSVTNAEILDPKLGAETMSLELPEPNEPIFKVPRERRRSSVTRRLYGITPRSRSGSISDAEPVKIGIPLARQKRRRSLVSRPRRGSVLRNIEEPTQEPEVSPATEKVIEQPPVNMIEEMRKTDAEFVMGIDPKTNKLSKFRLRSALPEVESEGKGAKIEEGDADLLPLAPDDLVTTILSIKQLPRKVKEDDLEFYSNLPVDVNNMTMADLCMPNLPFGKVSNNHESVKAAQKTIAEKRRQRRKERAMAREKRISMEEVARLSGSADTEEEERKKKKLALEAEEREPQVTTSLQLTLGADGLISYDADSAIVSRHSRTDNSSLLREESNPFENPVTSFTYSKRSHTDRWTTEEVNQFYDALSLFGTDFSLISQLFPYRTRKQIKLKFNLEEKKYPEIIALCLKRKLPADVMEYCKSSKMEIQSMEYYNEQLRQVRVQHEEHMAMIERERERAFKEDAEASRRREIEIRTGAKPMTRAERQKEMRKNEVVLGSIDDRKVENE